MGIVGGIHERRSLAIVVVDREVVRYHLALRRAQNERGGYVLENVVHQQIVRGHPGLNSITQGRSTTSIKVAALHSVVTRLEQPNVVSETPRGNRSDSTDPAIKSGREYHGATARIARAVVHGQVFDTGMLNHAGPRSSRRLAGTPVRSIESGRDGEGRSARAGWIARCNLDGLHLTVIDAADGAARRTSLRRATVIANVKVSGIVGIVSLIKIDILPDG